MKRVLDLSALGRLRKTLMTSHIGRVSIAFWGEEDASCTFSCHRQWQKKSVECLRVEATNKAGILVGLLEAWIFFSPNIVPAIPKQDPFQWDSVGRPIPVSRSFSLPRKQGT